MCDQIIRNEIRPNFRNGKFYEGIYTGVLSIIKATKGEYKGEGKGKKNSGSLLTLLVIAGLFGTFLFSFLRGGRRYGISSQGYNSSSYWSGFGGGGFGGSGGFGGGDSGGWSAGGGSFGGGGASGSW